MNEIFIKNANENNLKNISLKLPHNKLIVITGVSGSGKSSLAFDVIFQEGQRHFLESLSAKARQMLAKAHKPDVETIQGIRPAIALNQYTSQSNQRSTLGTLTGIYDLLRLLFARCGKTNSTNKLNRSLFSFNSVKGACPVCQGLGLVDRIDPDLLIKNPELSIREGAFEMTTPSGYIVYSQVTQEVLNSICKVHKFSIDIPWEQLTEEDKHIVLYGSNRIKVPFGKHTLESRLKWSGITAKPREEGYYKGIIPVMEEILKRDRNSNILRFARSHKCPECNGDRLNQKALDVKFEGNNIAYYSNLTIDDLIKFFNITSKSSPVYKSVKSKIETMLINLQRLGLGYLSLSKRTQTLSTGEIQRARLAALPSLGLQNMIFVLDEPSAGMHMKNNQQLINILRELRDLGNSVIIVEHEMQLIKAADWLIDLGPKAGKDGGEILYNGPLDKFIEDAPETSFTKKYFNSTNSKQHSCKSDAQGKGISIIGAREDNLKNIDVDFPSGVINVVTGLSGSGKRSLVNKILANSFMSYHGNKHAIPGEVGSIEGLNRFKKLIWVDQKPIGKTSRSNPATYTKVFDHIRKLFATLDTAKAEGFKNGHFSFNNKAGYCSKCQGTGQIQIGMHFMDDAFIECDQCKGKRYKSDILTVKYKNKSIAEILEMSVLDALILFSDQEKISKILQTMVDLGIGYLKLGQSSTTLSGGEAQRIKLSLHLANNSKDKNLFILDEPSGGLHPADNEYLLNALHSIAHQGNCLIIIEQDPQLIMAADNVIEMGPKSGDFGGQIIFSGSPKQLIKSGTSIIAQLILQQSKIKTIKQTKKKVKENSIICNTVSTHNLKEIDLTIPHNSISTITGISGSGKSSLVYDTIYAESNRRFTGSLSTYARTYLEQSPEPDAEAISGLTPAIAITQHSSSTNPRSTVGTFTGVYDYLRLIFSRLTEFSDKKLTTSNFSFNHQDGACNSCKGLGFIMKCDPETLILDPTESILSGAFVKHNSVKFYLDPKGQYIAILLAVAQRYNFNLDSPWLELSQKNRDIILYGTDNEQYKVIWDFKRGKREGKHEWNTTWSGLTHLIEDEYKRKHTDHRGKTLLSLMKATRCSVCQGQRLNNNALSIELSGYNIAEFSEMEITELLVFFTNKSWQKDDRYNTIINPMIPTITDKLNSLINTDLGYLTLNRTLSSLSGGELQRLRLANQINTGVSGITYILDEPSKGLHPHNRDQIFNLLCRLKNMGNTIIAVEHDPAFLKYSDSVIELGPGAGLNGGSIVFSGSPKLLLQSNSSKTALWMNHTFALPPQSKNLRLENALSITGAKSNNLKNINTNFYAGKINVITGVSGSGKSSLLFQTLIPSLKNRKPINCSKIVNFNKFNQIISIQTKEFKTNILSSVSSYSKILDDIRKIFAQQPEAKAAGYKSSSFSYLNKEGQCKFCKGKGENRIAMDFLSDIIIPCEECHGKRYNDQICAIKYQGKSIADVMDMTIMEAQEFFKGIKSLEKKLILASKLGINYLKLGQAVSNLSGGEKQRLMLIHHLLSNRNNNTLIVMDEPSRGLHPADCEILLKLLQELKEQNNTIIMIEHNPQMILAADHIIDLGPEAGKHGGRIIAEGTIQDIINNKASLTGKMLSPYINLK